MSGPSLTQHRAIKEETIAINHDWIYNHADCRMVPMLYPTLL